MEERQYVPTPPIQPSYLEESNYDPELQKADEVLRKLGYVKQVDLDKSRQDLQDSMVLNSTHAKLESSRDGSDGRPKYDRDQVESYMRANGIYGNPEAAYKLMHEEELSDWTLKQKTGNKPKVSPIKGGSTGMQEDRIISRDKLAQMLKSPQGRAEYERNRDKYLQAMRKGQL